MLEAAATSAWDSSDSDCHRDWSHRLQYDGDCSDEMHWPLIETLPLAKLCSECNDAHNHSSRQLFNRQEELGLATASSEVFAVCPPYPGLSEWPSPFEVDTGQKLEKGVSPSFLPIAPQLIGIFNKGDIFWCGWNVDSMQLDTERPAVYDVDVTAINTLHPIKDCAPSFDLEANTFRTPDLEPSKSTGVLESHRGDAATT
ncbi:hypothetical protein C8J57DRAFT_1259342 [Mycena rebaudengoi]|nr:hypothetical protein C8J57DRAFT_1259342 [Mycena rebaudengoi]